MKPAHNNYSTVLAAVLRELHNNPVDMLSIGDGDGESLYIENAFCSYERTLRDVIRISDSFMVERAMIRILEIGAYLGVVSCSLARLGFNVTAFDIPEFMNNEKLNARYGRYGVATLSANLRDYNIPAEPGSFTLIIMCETLEHLNFNPLPVISELNRLLDKGGVLYVSLPNQASLINRLKLLSGRSIHNPVCDFAKQLNARNNMIVGIHWREYTSQELFELLTMGGFSVIEHDFFTTHNPSLAARMIYALLPWLRGNQTVIARKVSDYKPNFRFLEATR